MATDRASHRTGGELYFEEQQSLGDYRLTGRIVNFVTMVGIAFGLKLVSDGLSSSGSVGLSLAGVGLAVAFVGLRQKFPEAGFTTKLGPEGIRQSTTPSIWGDAEVDPAEIQAVYLIDEDGLQGTVDTDALPSRIRRLVEVYDLTGVYVETIGDQPAFSGIIQQDGFIGPIGAGISLKSNLGGLLLSDRPEELYDAIQSARGR